VLSRSFSISSGGGQKMIRQFGEGIEGIDGNGTRLPKMRLAR
jgi:hypothetical protein